MVQSASLSQLRAHTASLPSSAVPAGVDCTSDLKMMYCVRVFFAGGLAYAENQFEIVRAARRFPSLTRDGGGNCYLISEARGHAQVSASLRLGGILASQLISSNWQNFKGSKIGYLYSWRPIFLEEGRERGLQSTFGLALWSHATPSWMSTTRRRRCLRTATLSSRRRLPCWWRRAKLRRAKIRREKDRVTDGHHFCLSTHSREGGSRSVYI